MKQVFAHFVLATAALASFLWAQQAPTAYAPVLKEFPVTMRQNIVAGKTPIGTKIQAKLTIATLIDGKVAPIGAVFNGAVLESVAKSATVPSRLSVRIDSIEWKNNSVPVKAYLTNWYYPILLGSNENLSHDSPGGMHGEVGAQTGTTRQMGQASTPFPTGANQQGPDLPPAPTSSVSDHRILLKDVDSTHADDGSLAITSTRSNIKLDKSTTYVLATGDLSAAK